MAESSTRDGLWGKDQEYKLEERGSVDAREEDQSLVSVGESKVHWRIQIGRMEVFDLDLGDLRRLVMGVLMRHIVVAGGSLFVMML